MPDDSPRPLRKPSHAVPCASAFRDAVLALAAHRGVTPGEIARAVMLLLPARMVADWPDPGEPAPGDREQVVLKSGPSAGKPWQRKPRLQVRLPDSHAPDLIRRALAIALAMAAGELLVSLESGRSPRAADRLTAAEAELARLRGIVQTLAFLPLAEGVRSRTDALYVLGFPPNAAPDARQVKARFRTLATIFHPDAATGDHRRMSLLNQAADRLRAPR